MKMFRNVNLTHCSSVRVLVVFLLLPFICNCAGMAIDSLAKSTATDKAYEEYIKDVEPVKDGYGRLFIYRAEASTTSSLQAGYGISKDSTLFTIDDTAHELVWEAFKYIDLPEGEHEFTCGNDIIKPAFSLKEHYQKGSNKIQLSIKEGADLFIRLDSYKNGFLEDPSFMPEMVEESQALEEISELPYQKSGFKYSGGKIED